MCSTGYRRGAGWTIPVGAMLNSGLMTRQSSMADIQDDAETVASFFSQVGGMRAAAGQWVGRTLRMIPFARMIQ
jgi:hypothetical protein